ncbi:hypothetical protein JVU11DRAFT_7801 [Chiua virens]|nr:hypothetical protein JVU11DRAFT_7801 [Chiua virens]
MSLKGFGAVTAENILPGTVPLPPLPATSHTPIDWDWDIEHADRRREANADAVLHDPPPFQVDRRVLKDIVREKTHCEVGRIIFLSSGTFHKAYLITLADTRQLVARVARRFMPRLKTQSEVATMQYLRERTSIPVPDIYFYDSNPFNRLGGEYILMSKASGIPLGRVYHSMSNEQLKILFKNVASIIIPLFAQRFSHVGSLHFPTSSRAVASPLSSSSPTPTATHVQFKHFSMSTTPTSAVALATARDPARCPSTSVHVGPIVSWPFFGSGRGDLTHPNEIDRGPWTSTRSYLKSCVQREIAGAKRESEGKSAPHRLHLDPHEIRSSRHHHLDAVPDDESDDSDEWDAQESEDEWEGPGDTMYSDYRRMQRSTFLVAHIMQREQSVRKEWAGGCASWIAWELMQMVRFRKNLDSIVMISTWKTSSWTSMIIPKLHASSIGSRRRRDHCGPVLTSRRSSRRVRLRRSCSGRLLPRSRSPSRRKTASPGLAATAKEWLHYEAVGTRLRLAHRCVEWDGWEEGLIDSILGPEEHEEEWFRDVESTVEGSEVPSAPSYNGNGCVDGCANDASRPSSGALRVAALRSRKQAGQLPLKKAMEQEQTLVTTGDICGGRGGELGRRLEAWLSVNGDGRRADAEMHDGGPH